LFESFTVIPAIDLKGGQVVRLLRGDLARATVYGSDPAEVARRFEADGARLIHVVDLDGAVAGEPRNLDAVAAIRAAVKCELDVSGGLRTLESIRKAIAKGADRISLGSAAFLEPELLAHACAQCPGRVFGSLDVRDGRPAIRGWTETSELTIEAALARFRSAGAAALIVTDVGRDGTEAGVDAERFRAIAGIAGLPVIASGGVAGLDDIWSLRALFSLGIVGVIVGRALYEGRFRLTQALAAAR
jgi:phosphoribosylformimino-5-aminoimidazole carboxamide ribotide isomerase